MSAGPFTRSIYLSDTTLKHPIRVQPETLEAEFAGDINEAPAGPTTSEISAQVTGSRRGLGLFARYVTVVFTTTPPLGYSVGKYYRIPVLDPTVFSGIALLSAGEYLGVATQVISKTSEVRR